MFKGNTESTIYKETFMYLWKKYWYILLIYFEHKAQRREETVVSLPGPGHLLNDFNASLLDLIAHLWLRTRGSRTKGPRRQWKLPTAQIYSRPFVFLPSKHFVHTELLCISWKLLPARCFLPASRLHWQLITAAFWNLPLGTNLVP